MLLSRPASPQPRPLALSRWLLLVAAMVFLIVTVGGITRLTESGLSITEWKPLRGTIPPLTEGQWQAEFDNYKRIPQYAAFNAQMTLDGFKRIFFWEYVHRLLARTIGLVLALVALGFWWRRAIPAGYGRRLIALLALGGLQGVIGWWMVASGLSARTEVSHVRLAIHLLAALLIFSALVWTILDLRTPGARPSRLTPLGLLPIALLVVQLALGAFTAGLRAGYAFSSWPKMGDDWFPAGVTMLAPGWRNLVDNPIVVQFAHRWWAWVVAIVALAVAAVARRRGFAAAPALIAALLAAQIGLGIATLLSGVALPIAVAHQAMAALLLAGLVAVAHHLGRRAA